MDTPRSQEFPVSFAQQRLWFLEQLEGAGAAYTVRLPVRLRGQLDARLLQRALDALVERHETLRTTIEERQGEPVQVIAAQLALPLEIIPMEGATEPELRRRVTDAGRHRFDLARGPLLRVCLFRMSPVDHVLLILTHHVVSDAWSSGVLFHDLAAIYEALVTGREPALPDLAVQYADFAAWQRDWLQGEELARQSAFWTKALAGAPPLLDLATDRPRPAIQTYRGSRWTRILPRELSARLRGFSGAEGCTLFMTLLSAFYLLLARYSGQDDIVVGTPVAGRRRTELEPLIGFFANTLLMRGDLSGDPSFRELLARVRRTALAAWEHQDLPFEKLVEALRPARTLSHSPLFQAMFVLQNVPWEASSMPGLEVSPAETDAPDTAKFDLTLSATEYGGEIWLAFEYSTDLFEEETIARLSAHYEALLRGAMDAPAARIADLALHDDGKWPRNWRDSKGPEVSLDPSVGVHHLVEDSVRLNPGAVAIEADGRRWSYAALDEWADTLADRLRALGAGPGVIVGVCLERSPEMVGAMLGILKSGAAYLPLDPAFPEERIGFMLEDSGARWLITGRRLATRFPAFGGVLCIEDRVVLSDPAVGTAQCLNAPAADCAATARPAGGISAGQLAYLIYTSGSTGRPKGVQITHGGVVNFLAGMLEVPGLGAADRLLAVTTLSFDIAVLELLGPLCAGATVVIAPAADTRDGAALARRLDEDRITVMQATPATWRALLAAGWRGRAGLKMLCGGEALDADLAARLLATGGALWNMYGPTETTVWSTCGEILSARDISVGRPIANTQLQVLDGRGRAAPPGVPGELHIGGAGVSPGYHRRPGLTAERFVANRADAGGSGTLYRTGDRARFLNDGRVQVLGRLDTQVKVRGFRIELGEVQSVLGAVAGVESCAVGVREAGPGDARLVAWVVVRTGAEVSVAALRAALKRQLPDYMLPAAFVMLAALPLTPNGKLDRAALPAPAWGSGPGEGYVAPRSAVEEALCGLFGEVLGSAGAVGIFDDFFALGGHSLLATQLVSRIRDSLAVEVPLRILFESPTVAALGEVTVGAASAAISTPQARVVGRGLLPRRVPASSAPLSYTQQRLWFLDQLEPGNAAYNLHAAFGLRGAVDSGALDRALQFIVARHEALRTTFASRDGEPVQVIHSPPQSGVRLARLDSGALNEAQLREQLVSLSEQPFDLGTGPLLRATLISTGTQPPSPSEPGPRHVLLLVIHHIVADGWSLALLLGELSAAYNAYIRGEAPGIPPLPIQYADYAQWQRQWLSGGELERQLAYWTGQLRGAPPVINLPHDRPRLPVQRYRGAWHTVTVSATGVPALTALAQREQATLFMVLLAAFEVLLARYGGDEELLVGVPIAGRNRTELEGLVGFFVNTLVLRGDLRGNPAFRELLARVKRTALDAYSCADVPFERLVEALEPQRSRAWLPLAQVLFVFHNEPRHEPVFDGIEVRGEIVASRFAKFDLSLHAALHDGALVASFGYNTDLFDRETVQAMAESYAAILGDIGRDAGRRVGDISLLSDTQRERARAEAARVRPKNPFVEVPASALAGTIPQRFSAQVAAHADRPAVSWRESIGAEAPPTAADVGAASAAMSRQWSYAELDSHSRAVAADIDAVTGPGTGRIALLLGHDGVMVAGLLGVLQAGKSYVPLDPFAPQARNEWVLQNAGVEAIVTDAPRLAAAPWLHESGLPVILADQSGGPGSQAESTRGADSLAYILYTSGTTGHPKAVPQTHRHVLGHISTWTRQLHLDAGDRLALFASYCFDAAVQDLFGALLNGACVHAVDLRGGESAPQIVDRIAGERLSVLHMTPTVYRHLFGGRVTCEQDLSHVRLVVLGGEEARRSDLDLFKVRFRRGTVFVNGLGLTESTMALQYFADHDTRVLGQRLPVGQPVPGTGVQLLEERQGARPWRGEIGLSSPYLTPGYDGDAALTAARMHALAAADQPRIFLSGDLARRLPDGQLLHAGRRDTQVKIRGIRIEPAEIEVVLRGDPLINDCVVTAVDREPGDQLLVAYVTTPVLLDEQGLRARLRRQLPEYLVPSVFVTLRELPRFANGKVDRRALPEPVPGRPSTGAVAAPRDEIEERLVTLWCGVLQRERIGIHDDFFALGGHSLLATRLIARVRDAFGLEVPLLALFESPTIVGMADAVERAGARAPEPGMPALKRRPRRAAGSGG